MIKRGNNQDGGESCGCGGLDILLLESFSATGPADTRRSRSFGSFFIRYRVIASADAPNTARKTQACQ